MRLGSGPTGADQLPTSGVDHAPLGYPRGGGSGDGGGKGAKDCVHPLPGVLIPALRAPAGGQSPQVKGRCRSWNLVCGRRGGRGTASQGLTLNTGFSVEAGITRFLKLKNVSINLSLNRNFKSELT